VRFTTFQHVGDLARDRVGAAAGGPRHDQRDRPLREGSFAFPAPSRLAAASVASAKFLAKFLTWRNISKSSRFVFYAPGETPRRRAYALSAIRAAERRHVKGKCRHIGATETTPTCGPIGGSSKRRAKAEGVVRHQHCSASDSILFSKNESESRKSARGNP
jgi:hypothetical protein